MDWDDVRVLLALLRARNLHEAARRMGVDRSTISRRLASLEKKVRTPLFLRTRDGLRPNAVAERLRPHAEAMELEAAALARAAQEDGEERPAGPVRVATTELMGGFLVAAGLLDLASSDVVVELLAGNRQVDLLRGEADVAVRVAPVRHASLRVRCLARVAVGLFASPSYLRTHAPLGSTRALAGHEVLLPSDDLEGLPEARWLAARSDVRVAFRSSSMLALLAAAAAGRGLVPLPLPVGERERGLTCAVVMAEVPRRAVWLVTRAGATSPVRLVADRIAALF